MSDDYYLSLAYSFAQDSKDPSTQNGAVLVRNDEIIGRGVNNFPNGVTLTADRWERPRKYAFVEHAERNAIFDAARQGLKTAGSTMFCPWFACADCARAIIQAGVKEVVGHETALHASASPSWFESIEIAHQMLDEAGVKRRYLTGAFGHKIRFNEELVSV